MKFIELDRLEFRQIVCAKNVLCEQFTEILNWCSHKSWRNRKILYELFSLIVIVIRLILMRFVVENVIFSDPTIFKAWSLRHELLVVVFFFKPYLACNWKERQLSTTGYFVTPLFCLCGVLTVSKSDSCMSLLYTYIIIYAWFDWLIVQGKMSLIK